jgi:hypothetical protein
MSAFEEFAIEIREFYDLDTVYPYRVGQAYTKAAAELERLQAIASAFFKIVSPDGFHQCGFNEECPECGESETHADGCKLAAALSPQPGDGEIVDQL